LRRRPASSFVTGRAVGAGLRGEPPARPRRRAARRRGRPAARRKSAGFGRRSRGWLCGSLRSGPPSASARRTSGGDLFGRRPAHNRIPRGTTRSGGHAADPRYLVGYDRRRVLGPQAHRFYDGAPYGRSLYEACVPWYTAAFRHKRRGLPPGRRGRSGGVPISSCTSRRAGRRLSAALVGHVLDAVDSTVHGLSKSHAPTRKETHL
jgi:hypothetical protein